MTPDSTKTAIARIMADGRWRTVDDLTHRVDASREEIASAVTAMFSAGLLERDRSIYQGPTIYCRAADLAAPTGTAVATVVEIRCTEEDWLKHMPGAGKRAPWVVGPPSEGDNGIKQQRISDALREHGPMTLSELAGATGFTRAALANQMQMMRNAGAARIRGQGHVRKWEVAA